MHEPHENQASNFFEGLRAAQHLLTELETPLLRMSMQADQFQAATENLRATVAQLQTACEQMRDAARNCASISQRLSLG